MAREEKTGHMSNDETTSLAARRARLRGSLSKAPDDAAASEPESMQPDPVPNSPLIGKDSGSFPAIASQPLGTTDYEYGHPAVPAAAPPVSTTTEERAPRLRGGSSKGGETPGDSLHNAM